MSSPPEKESGDAARRTSLSHPPLKTTYGKRDAGLTSPHIASPGACSTRGARPSRARVAGPRETHLLASPDAGEKAETRHETRPSRPVISRTRTSTLASAPTPGARPSASASAAPTPTPWRPSETYLLASLKESPPSPKWIVGKQAQPHTLPHLHASARTHRPAGPGRIHRLDGGMLLTSPPPPFPSARKIEGREIARRPLTPPAPAPSPTAIVPFQETVPAQKPDERAFLPVPLTLSLLGSRVRTSPTKPRQHPLPRSQRRSGAEGSSDRSRSQKTRPPRPHVLGKSAARLMCRKTRRDAPHVLGKRDGMRLTSSKPTNETPPTPSKRDGPAFPSIPIQNTAREKTHAIPKPLHSKTTHLKNLPLLQILQIMVLDAHDHLAVEKVPETRGEELFRF
ncbi:hypothetical protein K438DRAFT_1990389 [Mycena galopus ATCC 62051]|nr:hypothetical protein K438DRAFT_1990389 [Mycena galopus ATCC 62051]